MSSNTYMTPTVGNAQRLMEIFRVNYIQFYEVKASSFAIDYTVEIHAKR